MELENQVCSIELAKRLKDLGVKQESLFFWDWHDDNYYAVKFSPYSCPGLERYSAFTVAELGELLQRLLIVDGKSYFLSCYKTCDHYGISYEGYNDKKLKISLSNTEANARSEMLIYLLENGLIKNE